MDTPTPVARKRVRKYNWDLLADQGWLFFPDEDEIAYQGASIRNSATAANMSVRIVRAEHEGVLGFLVTPKQ